MPCLNNVAAIAPARVSASRGRHEPEILDHLELVVNTVSMEEALDEPQPLPNRSSKTINSPQ